MNVRERLDMKIRNSNLTFFNSAYRYRLVRP